MGRILVWACVAGLLGVACSDDGGGGPGPSSSSTVGSEGGKVTAGGAEASIPAGALAADTEVGVAEVKSPPAAPENYALAGPAIAFTPHGTAFEEAVTLTLPFESEASELVVIKLDDEEDTEWAVVQGAEFGSGEASVSVKSFSIYAVAEASGDSDDADAGGSEGSDSGTTGTGQAANCAELCEVQVGLSCENGPTQNACEEQCTTQGAQWGTGVCKIDAEAYGLCISDGLETNFACDADGEPSLKDGVCTAQFEAFFTCITTGVNSKGETEQTDGSVIASCEEQRDSANICSDYIGAAFATLPIEEAICSGDAQTFSEEPCVTEGAIGVCHVDEGGTREQKTYYFPLSDNVDATIQQQCEQALQGVFTAL